MGLPTPTWRSTRRSTRGGARASCPSSPAAASTPCWAATDGPRCCASRARPRWYCPAATPGTIPTAPARSTTTPGASSTRPSSGWRAEGIAGELGIVDGGRTVSGTELDELTDEKLDAVLDEVAVFARVTPSHKVRIVDAYRRRGSVVAMTGDGANDAPAIRLADVGIALGENATPA